LIPLDRPKSACETRNVYNDPDFTTVRFNVNLPEFAFIGTVEDDL
jgi:hypothetical protein